MKTYTILWDYNITVAIKAKSKEDALRIFLTQCDWVSEGHQVIGLEDVVDKGIKSDIVNKKEI
jgi:hypothetical protein